MGLIGLYVIYIVLLSIPYWCTISNYIYRLYWCDVLCYSGFEVTLVFLVCMCVGVCSEVFLLLISVAFVMSLVADFTGGVFGVVVVRCFGVLVGDGFDDGNGVLVGELLSPL